MGGGSDRNTPVLALKVERDELIFERMGSARYSD